MKNFILLAILLVTICNSIYAQIVEGTPCTATCIDYNKSSITGRQPNQNGVSPNLNLACGSGTTEDNPGWWIFRPAFDSVKFQITTSNCVAGVSGVIGVEMTLWVGDNCGAVTTVKCVVGSSGILVAKVDRCKVYYLQIDGVDECQCNVILTYDNNQILKEVPVAVVTGPTQICIGASAKFNASLPTLPVCQPDDWKWTIDPASAGTATKTAGSPNDVNIKITNPPANGKVKLCAEPVFKGKCPPTTKKTCVEVEVLELKPATCKVDLCPEERPVVYELINCIKTTNPTFSGHTNPETYVINFPPNTKKSQKIIYTINGTDCQREVTLNINVFDNKPVQLPPVILCQGEERVVKGITFGCAAAGTSLKQFVQVGNTKPMCGDTTFEMLIQCIKFTPRITGIGTLDCSRRQLTLNAGGAGTITLPNSVSLSSYIGVGTREYKWSKDGVEIPGETKSTLLVTAPGLFEVTLSYTYEVNQKINGVQGVYRKTCFKTAQALINEIPGTAVAETPTTGADPCAFGDATYSVTPDVNATSYKWSVIGATIIGSDNDPRKVVVRNGGSPYQVCLVKNACNNTSAPSCITITPISSHVKPVLSVTPLCQGDSSYYTVNNTSSFSQNVHYSWKVKNGTIVRWNKDSTEIFVRWNKASTSGNVTLFATDCLADSASQIINFVSTSTIASNSPVCAGSALNLSASGGTDYQWSGPNGFSSTLQNPSFPNSSSLQSGIYTVTISGGSECTNVLQTAVTVGNLIGTINSNSPICAGNLLQLSASGGNSYIWSGPNGFTSNQQNPTIVNAAALQSGVYSVTITLAGSCSSVSQTTVTVTPLPSIIKSNSPVCHGNLLQLNAEGGNSYQWSGPNGFTSTLQNPIISNITDLEKGTYIVFIGNSNGCNAILQTQVDIISNPTISAGSNSPLCTGNLLKLSAGGGNTYSWSGPNGFSSNLQNPTIANISSIQSGTYLVTVTNSAGCSSIAEVNVLVNIGGTISAVSTSNSPVCENDNLLLLVAGGISYSWSGPNGFTSTQQNPIVQKVLKQQEGTYTVIVTGQNGCTGSSQTTIMVKDLPQIVATCSSPVCIGSTVYLLSVGGNSFLWSGPDNFQSNLQNPILSNVTIKNAGIYLVTTTGPNNCKNSTTTKLEVLNCVGNKDIYTPNQIKIFPNPARDELNIVASDPIYKVEVLNLLGQKLMQKIIDAKEATIDLTDFTKGKYILKVYENEREYKVNLIEIIN